MVTFAKQIRTCHVKLILSGRAWNLTIFPFPVNKKHGRMVRPCLFAMPARIAGLVYSRYLSWSATKLASTTLSTRLITRLGVLNVYRCELTVTT